MSGKVKQSTFEQRNLSDFREEANSYIPGFLDGLVNVKIPADQFAAPTPQIQSDWNQSDDSAVDFIKNKPTIPDAQVQADWDESDSTAVSFIQNKPTIPDAQVNSDWAANSGVAKILNKPDLEGYVSAKIAQNFTDEQTKQARDNIDAQKNVGGPGAYIDSTAGDSNNKWALIGYVALDTLGIGKYGSLKELYSNISLSLEATVYNTGSQDREVVEYGRFNINIHAEPINDKWLVDAGWSEYKGQSTGRLLECMRVSRKVASNGDIQSIYLHLKVPEPATFYNNTVNVIVLNNYGSSHLNDSLNHTKCFIAPWKLNLGAVYSNFLGLTEKPMPIDRYITSNYTSYIDYNTFNGSTIEIRPQYQATAITQATLNRGNLPVVINNSGVLAIPNFLSNSVQRYTVVGENADVRSLTLNDSLSNSDLLGYSHPYHGRMQVATISGETCIANLYDCPVDGTTQSIGIWASRPSATALILAATWHYSDASTPVPSKDFLVRTEIEYYDNNVIKTEIIAPSTTPITLTPVSSVIAMPSCSFSDIDKITIDLVGVADSPKRWFHVEYLPRFGTARIFEDFDHIY